MTYTFESIRASIENLQNLIDELENELKFEEDEDDDPEDTEEESNDIMENPRALLSFMKDWVKRLQRKLELLPEGERLN